MGCRSRDRSDRVECNPLTLGVADLSGPRKRSPTLELFSKRLWHLYRSAPIQNLPGFSDYRHQSVDFLRSLAAPSRSAPLEKDRHARQEPIRYAIRLPFVSISSPPIGISQALSRDEALPVAARARNEPLELGGAAVDKQLTSGDEAAVVRSKEKSRAGTLLRFTEPP